MVYLCRVHDAAAKAAIDAPDLNKNTFYPSFVPDHEDLTFYPSTNSDKNRSIRWDIVLNDTDF
jgi:hypothetical protein